jgi:hypothetical protein
MRRCVIAAVLALAGCSNNSAPVTLPTIPQISPAPAPASVWRADSGTTDGAIAVSPGNSFTIPTTAPGVGYVTKSVSGLPASGTVTLSYSVAVTGSPVFDYRTATNNTCGTGSPGTVRLFIQRAGDTETGTGVYQQYRYWAISGFKALAPGLFTISAPLDPAQWSDVYGALGSANPSLFAAALSNAGRVGFTFGGGCFYGHGVFNSGGGTAQFTINSFTVN